VKQPGLVKEAELSLMHSWRLDQRLTRHSFAWPHEMPPSTTTTCPVM
jgi:hypothetical protein